MSFTLTGHNFTIGPYDYILEVQGSCISSFFGKLRSSVVHLGSRLLLNAPQAWTFLNQSDHWQYLVMRSSANGTQSMISALIVLGLRRLSSKFRLTEDIVDERGPLTKCNIWIWDQPHC